MTTLSSAHRARIILDTLNKNPGKYKALERHRAHFELISASETAFEDFLNDAEQGLVEPVIINRRSTSES